MNLTGLSGLSGIVAGGSVWSPGDLAGLAATLLPALSRSQGLLWQDGGKTVPAEADGDLVRVAVCPFTGTDYTFASDAARATLQTDGGGRWWLQCGGSVDASATVSALDRRSFGFLAATRPTSRSAQKVLLDGDTVWVAYQTLSSKYANHFDGVTTDSTLACPAPSVVHGLASTAGGVTYRRNAATASVSAFSSATTTALRVGQYGGGAGFGWQGRVYGLVPWSGSVSVGDLASLDAYLAALMPPKLVVCEGNSLTSGNGATAGNDYPSRLGVALGADWEAVNTGLSGHTTTGMAADAPSELDPAYRATRSKNVLIAWEVTNELYFGESAATALANYKAYCAARRAAGWYVVAVTVLPRSNGGTPGSFEADRQTVNTGIRDADELGVSWDAVADVAADSRIGDAGDEGNLTYYGDAVHLTDAGYQIIADIVAPVVAAA